LVLYHVAADYFGNESFDVRVRDGHPNPQSAVHARSRACTTNAVRRAAADRLLLVQQLLSLLQQCFALPRGERSGFPSRSPGRREKFDVGHRTRELSGAGARLYYES